MRNFKSFFLLLLAFILISERVAAQKSASVKDAGKTAQTSVANADSKDAAESRKTSSKNNLKPFVAKSVDKTQAARAQAAFDELKTVAESAERIAKINRFIHDFPNSELKIKALEMLIVSEIEAGESSFQSGDRPSGAEHFQQAARAFDSSVSDGVFKDIIAKLPFNLFYRGEPAAALTIAKEIEPKINNNQARLLALANFYLATENGDEAKRLAARAAEIAPDSVEAQMSLGMAQRIAFHLEAAAQAYAHALELDATSVSAKRSLADAWRGLGQTEDALKLYRELLNANTDDEASRNGLVLALLSAGDKDEAEKELTAALAQNPKNLVLQTGAAYWYAANGDGAKAVELAGQAVAVEPRYVWGQIALARGLILEKRLLEAEHALVTARQYGKFPTLDYELANAHFALGLYDEAADDLRRSFTLDNGRLQTKLAGREQAEAENFNELLSRERRASIFEPKSASGELENRKLKELLALVNNLPENADQISNERALLKATQDFTADADEMQAHRELYAADKLLNRKIALEQVLTMTQKATDGLEKSLDVPAATAAVLAEELYEPRRVAALNGSILNIPVVPRETLRQIMRGRVEEIAGWALYQENKPEEAVVHLRRAVGVLPENSAWWRLSYWRLGSALEAGGKSKEALDAYLKSYQADLPNEARLVIIKSLYQRVYGSLDGFEERMNQRETANTTLAPRRKLSLRPEPVPAVTPSFKNPLPNVIGEIVPATPNETSKDTEAKPIPTPETTPAPPEAKLETSAEAKAGETAAPKLESTPVIENTPVATASPTPEIVKNETSVAAEPVAPTAENKSSSEPVAPPLEAKPEPAPSSPPATEAKVEQTVAPKAETEATTADKAGDKPELKAEPIAESVGKTLPVPESLEAKTDENSAKLTIAPETPVQPPAANENVSPEKKIAEPAEKAQELEPTKNAVIASAATEQQAVDEAMNRPRVIIVPLNSLPVPVGNKTESDGKPPTVCTMQVNQSELSILRNGGTVALIITFSSAADAAKLKITVNSPNDISVVLLPNDEADGTHRLIQISSISEITKNYTVTLESPCGQEEVKVKVR